MRLRLCNYRRTHKEATYNVVNDASRPDIYLTIVLHVALIASSRDCKHLGRQVLLHLYVCVWHVYVCVCI